MAPTYCPFPSNNKESEEEEERPFDVFSLNNNLSSEDESEEDEDDGHDIFLPSSSDEEDEDEDDNLSHSSEEEEWNDTTSVEPELDTRVVKRIRRKNWIDRQIKLLLIAIEESRRRDTRTGQINWKAVEKHRCIEQLKTERPTDTIEHFRQKYRNLLKQDRKKYNDIMATL
ncbi:predicted protein [Chaetoceros tenuissimus]|uniref:Uncharacterized protein n=1 Tax=Chaetoceros tenuissimus TaxID=426638 RepID=A0AAD3CES8_9STRA|nr:predicted protein [Chaetoceros tenuissimus]